jgi:hypothetical protein
MARTHFVKAARKDYPDAGIKRGEAYYWWKFRYGGKNRQKTPPKASQLTQSEFMGTIYDIEERIAALSSSEGIESLQADVASLAEELRNLGSEQDDKRNNMPDSLQDSETGQLLESRQQACEEMADALEDVDLDIEKEEGESEEDFQGRIDDAITELQGVSYNGD